MATKSKSAHPVPIARITDKIYRIRDLRVMLDKDLAMLYQVETKALKQAVRRNIERFPDDFMFELSADEFSNLRSQSVTSTGRGRKTSWQKIRRVI